MVGWHTVRLHSALVFKIVLSLFAVQVAFEIVTKVLTHTLVGVLAATLLLGLGTVAGFGATVVSLKLIRKESARYGDLFPPSNMVIRYILSSLLVALSVLAPLIIAGLLIAVGAVMGGVSFSTGTIATPYVPMYVVYGAVSILLAVAMVLSGYILLRYSLVRFLVIDGATVMESLRRSVRITKGHALQLLGFFSIFVVLNILGALLFLVGLLVTVPVTVIAYAQVYQKLRGHIEANQ